MGVLCDWACGAAGGGARLKPDAPPPGGGRSQQDADHEPCDRPLPRLRPWVLLAMDEPIPPPLPELLPPAWNAAGAAGVDDAVAAAQGLDTAAPVAAVVVLLLELPPLVVFCFGGGGGKADCAFAAGCKG